jgi:ABC-type spermidine/putrescine transport system permease subunit II
VAVVSGLLLFTLYLVLETHPLWWQSLIAVTLAALGVVVVVVDSGNRSQSGD